MAIKPNTRSRIRTHSILPTLIVMLFFSSPTFAQNDKDLANDYFRQSEQKDYGTQNNNPLTYDLSGHLWKIQGTLPGRGMEEKFPEISYDHMGDALNWAPAHVPGDVFSDLWRIGRIDDPHFGRNSIKAKWVNEYEWWYLRIFNVPKEMEGKNVEITFDGVDYACDVFLNGKLLGSHEGMFTAFSFDITDLISDEDIRFTQRDGQLYAIALGWPESGVLPIETLSTTLYNTKVKGVELIGHQGELKWEQTKKALEIKLPNTKPCENAFVFKINR